MTRIIGIDPGLANTGYGIIDSSENRYRLICHGVIKTPPKMEAGNRLKIIYETLEQLIVEYKPRHAGIEDIFFAKNAVSALPVAQAKGVALLVLAQYDIPVGEYPPPAIKQAIVGRGRAEKGQVQELIRILLGMESIPKPDHAADALAAAICHFNILNFSEVIKDKKDV